MVDRQDGRIEGVAIVSEDGMLADAARVMPDSLKFDVDQKFFEDGLNRADVVVHGRNSQEQQPGSRSRRRLIVTRSAASVQRHQSNVNALLWNPAGASLEEALTAIGMPDADVGVIGGPEVFALFLDRYDVFHLSRAAGVRLPGGRPVFPDVPARTPEDVLASHGLVPHPVDIPESAKGLSIVSWRR